MASVLAFDMVSPFDKFDRSGVYGDGYGAGRWGTKNGVDGFA